MFVSSSRLGTGEVFLSSEKDEDAQRTDEDSELCFDDSLYAFVHQCDALERYWNITKQVNARLRQ